MSRKALVFFPLSIGLIILDQLTKWWVYLNLELHRDQIEIIPGFFSLIHVQNPGAAFSIMRDFEYRIWIFILFGVFAAAIIIDMWRRLPRADWFMSLCLGLILSGALGNFIDRVHKQTVTDFMRFYTDGAPALHDWLGSHWPHMTEWPTWNVADAALVVGVGLFLVHYLFLEEKDPNEEEDEDEALPDEAPGSEASP